MTTLVDQLRAGGQFPHEDCGEACVVSILSDAGKADSVLDVERFDFGDGDNPNDGTGGQVHIDRLARAGIPAHLVRGPIGPVIAAAEAEGLNRWMVAIYSDHAGAPYTGPGNVGHWVLVTGSDPVGYTVMQPVGGVLQHYTRAQLEEAAQDYTIVVDVPIGAGVAAPALPATGGDDDMQYMAPGPPATPADLTARRVKIHEWTHVPGVNRPADWPAEAAMDRLLELWIQSGAEAVFAALFGA